MSKDDDPCKKSKKSSPCKKSPKPDPCLNASTRKEENDEEDDDDDDDEDEEICSKKEKTPEKKVCEKPVIKDKKPSPSDKKVCDTSSKKEVAPPSKPEMKICEASKPETKVSEDSSKKPETKVSADSSKKPETKVSADSSKKPETKVSADSSKKVSEPSSKKPDVTKGDTIKKPDLKQKLGAGIFTQQDKLKDMVGSLREKVLQFAPKIDMNQFKNVDYKTAIKNAFNAAREWIILNCDPKKMADKPGAPSRPMKFPYTFSAKIAQFPLTHYVKNQWIWRYYFIAVGVCIPVFWSINKLANSPGNVAKWAEIRRKEAAEHHH